MEDFPGELRNTDPKKLYKKDGDIVFSFFLNLAFVYNDLQRQKKIVRLFQSTYRKPKPIETTAHSGSYCGMNVHLNKYFVGILHEFFEFLKHTDSTNSKLFSTKLFSDVIQSVSHKTRSDWDELLKIAKGQDKSHLNLTLEAVRNKVSFHYNRKERKLENSFKNAFLNKTRNLGEKTKYAYFSTIDKKVDTIFYSDAAIEEYMREEISDKGFHTLIDETIAKTIDALRDILTTYLEQVQK
ncbi:hypothetical protein H6758_02260 [Candidatus Nomurabacteria bacterium]|nr:hypothetical protein [Candidatus Nomurabacteria bacterium]